MPWSIRGTDRETGSGAWEIMTRQLIRTSGCNGLMDDGRGHAALAGPSEVCRDQYRGDIEDASDD